jgi:flagellar motor protein MotB
VIDEIEDLISADEDPGTAAAYGDLVTAVLFVFIITLVAYVINFSSNQEQTRSLGQKVSDIVARQSYIVDQVGRRLQIYGIDHEAERKIGVIRISSDDLTFEPGSYHLAPHQGNKVAAIARALAAELPCYSRPSPQIAIQLGCGDEQSGQLRAVAIEGHTDNIPLGAIRDGVRDNTDLSLMRAATVLSHLRLDPVLRDLQNSRGQDLFHAAGYGDSRPIQIHDGPVSDRENRRIEIRLLLENPWAL